MHGLLHMAVDLDAFMDAISRIEGPESPPKKPYVETFVKARRHIAKSRQIIVPRQLPSIDISRNETRHRSCQFGAHSFVAVDAEAPFLRAVVERKLLLSAITSPWLAYEPNWETLSLELSNNLNGIIRRSRVDHYYLYTHRDALNTFLDISLFVFAYYECRNWQWHNKLSGITMAKPKPKLKHPPLLVHFPRHTKL